MKKYQKLFLIKSIFLFFITLFIPISIANCSLAVNDKKEISPILYSDSIPAILKNRTFKRLESNIFEDKFLVSGRLAEISTQITEDSIYFLSSKLLHGFDRLTKVKKVAYIENEWIFTLGYTFNTVDQEMYFALKELDKEKSIYKAMIYHEALPINRGMNSNGFELVSAAKNTPYYLVDSLKMNEFALNENVFPKEFQNKVWLELEEYGSKYWIKKEEKIQLVTTNYKLGGRTTVIKGHSSSYPRGWDDEGLEVERYEATDDGWKIYFKSSEIYMNIKWIDKDKQIVNVVSDYRFKGGKTKDTRVLPQGIFILNPKVIDHRLAHRDEYGAYETGVENVFETPRLFKYYLSDILYNDYDEYPEEESYIIDKSSYLSYKYKRNGYNEIGNSTLDFNSDGIKDYISLMYRYDSINVGTEGRKVVANKYTLTILKGLEKKDYFDVIVEKDFTVGRNVSVSYKLLENSDLEFVFENKEENESTKFILQYNPNTIDWDVKRNEIHRNDKIKAEDAKGSLKKGYPEEPYRILGYYGYFTPYDGDD